MKYCIANWKMNMTSRDSLRYLDDIGKYINEEKEMKNKTSWSDVRMIICPPYTSLDLMSSVIEESTEGIHKGCSLDNLSNIYVGAQNINYNSDGAYTGEISAEMLSDFGIKYVIVGHSERRALFGESNEDINLKIKTILENGLKPILCVGESLEDRASGKTEEILASQLERCLNDISCLDDFLIAYEPVWAIGTGENADNKIIDDANSSILAIIKDLGINIASPRLLYGGSVNNNNAENLSNICNLDGFLIGGASLDAKQFYTIYNTLKGE